MATISELIGVNPQRWITVRAWELTVGDQVKVAGWSRTIAAIYPAVDDLFVRFTDGTSSTIRPDSYATVLKRSRAP